MLKALELAGFKSFADKTRFEFPPGITVVVGPNGSGKSNIVDAMKWVLGEQSAKSLRGKEMTDVIFKGTAEGGRKALNAAEVTIIFDNSAGKLPFDAAEVHVTRRVYRSGEGEYLINGQPSRLKDVRDMFRGTGVGTDAYSLIEQGKVDQMLQASSKDRRAIFEEAAGISRFKAKKVEAQRRLERVEQNLLRLKDIVDEVENRVKTVRHQASKAHKYREFSDRLQQLRTEVGAADWRQLTRQTQELEQELQQLRDEQARFSAEAEALEARSLEVDVELGSADESIRLCDGRFARHHEQIVQHDAALTQSRHRSHELEEAVHRYRQQLAAMTGRVGDVQERLRDTTTALDAAESLHRDLRDRVATHERRLSDAITQLDARRSETESRRTQYVERMRQVAILGNRISGLESQLVAQRATETRIQQRLAELLASLAAATRDVEQQQAAERQLAEQVELKGRLLATNERELSSLREQLAEIREHLVQRQHRLSASRERAAVLEELEQNREGLTDGVREMLEVAQQATEDWHGEIEGLVADLLHVGVDLAPLVDIALGESAQHVVLNGGRLLEELQAGRFRPSGRVGFAPAAADLPTQGLAHFGWTPPETGSGKAAAAPAWLDDPVGPLLARTQNHPGVIGRADRLVRCDLRFRSLVNRLLGETWLVDSLPLALALRATAGRGCRFVTATGELVESDGSVVVGPRSTFAGLVSRRNELRELHEHIAELDREVAHTQEQFGRLHELVEQKDRVVKQLLDDHARATTQLAGCHAQTESAQWRVAGLEEQHASLATEIASTREQQCAAQQELDSARGELIGLEATVAEAQVAIQSGEREIEQLEAQRELNSREALSARVDLATADQQLDMLRARMTQFQEDERERSRAILEARQQYSQCAERLLQTEREILHATSVLAALYLGKESQARERLELQAARSRLAAERNTWSTQVQTQRKQAHRLEEQLHKLELGVRDLAHQRTTLAERLREDYKIEIAELTKQANAAEQAAREEIDREIVDLRRKLNNIGSVNMEALHELDQLETRFQSLNSQYQDLVQAKEALERIIQKINADSRRLFQETLEAIRVNFQTLYRRAFGGGRADIVLEEGVDPLDAGVELMATPPGKPQFNNSLLSGGEKALTAVALLLAIFQYRPSPFCVLDEVDAPFDEANIGRFVEVLKGFLGWTKFVIVTHSKKTMTAATTLYGVTMQESGVSKRVSVRFEDVSEDGHISQDATHRDDNRDHLRKAA